jgi:S-adenosylmethionine:tRNA ribosyltransferase-isomerase
MSPARAWRAAAVDRRLWVIDPDCGHSEGQTIGDLMDLLRSGDLLVLNDAGTLPGSLKGWTEGNAPVELRLAGRVRPGMWWAVLFGRGDWRTPTEERPVPPRLGRGARLCFGGDCALGAEVLSRSPHSDRLLLVRFDRAGVALLDAIYRLGQPIQYAYLEEAVGIGSVQTRYGGRPWAVEMPSAGQPLSWGLLQQLQDKGVGLARITHAAGLSATGDAALDARLPLPERTDIPVQTVDQIAATRAAGGRVIAVGTSVVRALEDRARQNGGLLVPGESTSRLILDAQTALLVVDGLLSGMHPVGESSHHEVLAAFCPSPVLAAANHAATAAGYLGHEFGDSCLVLAGAVCGTSTASAR